MADGKKKTNSKRRSGFWRSYSFVLTMVVLFSVSIVGASARKYTIEKGMIYRDQFGSWTPVTWGASSPGVASESQFDSLWQELATDVGIMSASAGGLTQAELNDSLQNYVGKRVSSYNFENGDSGLLSVTVSDLYDAIVKNQIYSTKPLYSSVSREYLSSTGGVSQATNGSKNSVADLLNYGFLGLHQNLVGSGSYSVSLSNASGGSTVVTASNLMEFYGKAFQVMANNQTSIYSKLNAVNTNLINFKNANHQDLVTVNDSLGVINRSLVGSGSSSVTYWDSSTKSQRTISYSDILSALTSMGTSMQNDLAKLRYVLASDKDIEIAEKQEPVKNAVADNFAGDSPASVKDTDVGNMAGFSGNFQDAFSTGANAADALGALTSSDSWLFWSQAVADDLNQAWLFDVEMVSVASLDDSDDDFIHFYDSSAIDAYLSGGDAS